jgi:cytoskeletal protein RodZ
MGALNSEQERAESLALLGAQLRQAREQHGLTLEEVAAETLIQPRMLQAIETGNLQALPEPVYIQGMIRRIADTLGLNGTEFAKSFPVATHTPTMVEPFKMADPVSLRPIHLYWVYLGVIIAAVGGLSFLMNRGGTNSGVATNTPRPNAAVSPANPRPTPVATPIPTQVQAAVTAQQEAWLEVRADGKVIYEGTMTPGAKQTWTAKKELNLYSGNAGGVMVSLNGAPAKPLGKPGQRGEATYKLDANPTATPAPGAPNPELSPAPPL